MTGHHGVSPALGRRPRLRAVLRHGRETVFTTAPFACGALWIVDTWHWLAVISAATKTAKSGFDLRFSWLAEHAFLTGDAPYAIHRFLYPPSELLVALPLGAVSTFHALSRAATYAVVAMLVGTIMLGATLIGRKPWGLTAAFVVYLASFAQPAAHEIILLNDSAIVALALAGVLWCSARGRWTWAAVILGVSLSLKPTLFPVLIVVALAKRWRALSVAIGIPVGLNVVAYLATPGNRLWWHTAVHVVNGLGAVGDPFNSAIASVGPLVGLPDPITWTLRAIAIVVAALAAWISWRDIEDESLRLTMTSGALMIGLFLAGSLTEDHDMLVLIPLLMTIFSRGSPLRWPPAWLGFLWLAGIGIIPGSALGMRALAALRTNRCVGLGLILLTAVFGLLSDRRRAARATRG